MPRRPRLTIVEHVKQMQKLNVASTEAQVEAALKDPAVAALKLADLLEEWTKKGPDDFLISDPEYQNFKQKISRQMLTEFFMSMRLAHDLLVKKIQTDGELIMPKDLSGIMSDLSRLMKAMNEVAQDSAGGLPQNTSELDQKIAELEKELRDDGGKPLDS